MDAKQELRNAWLSLLGIPVAMVATFLIGSFAFALVGAGDTGKAPLWLALVLFVLVAVLFALPVGIAFLFGMRAAEAGAKRPMLPAWIAAAVGVLVVVQNVAAYIFS